MCRRSSVTTKPALPPSAAATYSSSFGSPTTACTSGASSPLAGRAHASHPAAKLSGQRRPAARSGGEVGRGPRRARRRPGRGAQAGGRRRPALRDGKGVQPMTRDTRPPAAVTVYRVGGEDTGGAGAQHHRCHRQNWLLGGARGATRPGGGDAALPPPAPWGDEAPPENRPPRFPTRKRLPGSSRRSWRSPKEPPPSGQGVAFPHPGAHHPRPSAGSRR